MIIFRNFARKAAKKIINPLEQPYSLQKSNPLEQSDPLVDEFQKFIDKELSHGVASEETVFKNILGNKNLETIIRAIEAGQEIDLEKINFNFPAELEKALEGVIEEEESQDKTPENQGGELPPNLMGVLNKNKNR